VAEDCDLLIAHQAEIEETIDGLASQSESAKRRYLVLGTSSPEPGVERFPSA
jgi:hypothetical protein